MRKTLLFALLAPLLAATADSITNHGDSIASFDPQARLIQKTNHRGYTLWESDPVPVEDQRIYAATATLDIRNRVPGAALSFRLLLLDPKQNVIGTVMESSAAHQALFACGKSQVIRYSPKDHHAAAMKMQVIVAGNPATVAILNPTIKPTELIPKFPGLYTPKVPYPPRQQTLEEMKRIAPATAQLHRKKNGRLTLLVDGKETWLKSYKGSIDYGPFAQHDANTILTFAAGVNLFWDKISWDLSPYRGNGVFDFTHLENELMLIHKTAPQARVILNVDLDPGPEFFQQHPDSIFRNQKGQLAVRQFYAFAGFGVKGPDPKKHRHWIVSYASEDYLNVACDALVKLTDFLKNSPAGNIVIGFGLQGGHDAQFLQWEYSASRGQADYSPDSIKAFRKWLANKYGTDQKLQKAWEEKQVTLNNATLFTEEQWKSRNSWSDTRTGLDRKIADGRDFMTETIANLNRRFALTLKNNMNRPVIVGTYYSTPIWGQAGRSSLGKLSRDNAIDILFQVSGYSTLRKVGAIGATANFAIAAAHASNMLFAQEMDHRTPRSQMTAPEHISRISLCYPRTYDEFKNQMLRDAGAVIAYGGDGYYYFDMFDSWFNDPRALEVVKTTNFAADWSLKYRDHLPRTQAAIFLDERQRLLSMEASSAPGSIALAARISGITPDIYLLDDLTKDTLPDYDLWIVPDSQTLSQEQLKALIAKAQKPGKVIMLTGAPGALTQSQPGTAATTLRRLGITVQDHLQPRQDSIEFIPHNNHPMTRDCTGRIGLQDLFITKGNALSQDTMPFFTTIADPQATIVGRWAKTGEPALAVKNLKDRGTIVYAAHPAGLSPQLIHNAARQAGITPHAQPGNSIAVGNGVIAIHRLQQPVEITFTEAMECVDPQTGKTLAVGKKVQVPCQPRTSRLICYRKNAIKEPCR